MAPLLGFLNTTKYPASFDVPFFYYLLHIPLIHAAALLVSVVRLGELSPWLFTNHPDGECAGA
jgi:hypothetical protein